MKPGQKQPDRRSPWLDGYRTFGMIVRGRKPTVQEIIDGMGPEVRLWDGSDGIEPVRIRPYLEPAHDPKIGDFEVWNDKWKVTVIATITGMPVRPSLVEATEVDLGELDLSSPQPEPRRLAPEGVDPYDPSTWPEGYKVRWERVSTSPEEQAAFGEGFREASEPKVLGTIEVPLDEPNVLTDGEREE
jgi:hypothetical protein